MHTLSSFSLALLMQAQSGSASEGSGKFILGLVARSVVAQIVVFALLLFSILSWGIILYKFWVFYRANRHSTQFLDVFRRSAKFSEVQAICRSVGDSPLVGMFQSGYAELTAQLRQSAPAPGGQSNPQPPANRPTLKSLSAVDRALLRASVVEMNKLEHGIPFLATTASVSPFIGLFGTVWGIMTAFQGIAETGSTNLGAVAPGIADALITTALGLAAAIPAVVFYNHLSNRVKQFGTQMDDFAMEFLNICERNFT
ncbi:MAG TPA: MotA/TolQ/ExbB proton channel family protein [Vicinamibacterales bacterium]|nr:MotA/TolQ/ExbB proton channel family protein [Vicinamibacterales bacterium]